LTGSTDVKKPCVLTIAAIDSSSGAGATLDLKVFQALGVYGTCAVTAVTAQNTVGVQKVNKIPPRVVGAQIDSIAKDMTIAAAKTGMLWRAHTVSIVAARIKRRSIPNLVVDPIIFASDGTRLLSREGVLALKLRLVPQCAIVTPNLAEAAVLTGLEVSDVESMKRASEAIAGLGPKAVLVKGGHLTGVPTDILFDGEDFVELRQKRRVEDSVHGTGCMLSAALAARLALGDSVNEAAQKAHEFTARALESAQKMGKGALVWS
jgi:hydroxymethylpyrimidine kinase/phosphomethylpyrimidine kinase